MIFSFQIQERDESEEDHYSHLFHSSLQWYFNHIQISIQSILSDHHSSFSLLLPSHNSTVSPFPITLVLSSMYILIY